MSFLRLPRSSSSALRQPFRSVQVRSALPLASRRYASGDYGSGTGDPVGEKPQEQGKNPSEDKEHPGPPPPSGAKGNSSGSSTEQSSSNKSSQTTSKGAQPKILADNPPATSDESVRKHNEEMEQRAEKADSKVSNEDAKNDKVPKGFWSGKAAFMRVLQAKLTGSQDKVGEMPIRKNVDGLLSVYYTRSRCTNSRGIFKYPISISVFRYQ